MLNIFFMLRIFTNSEMRRISFFIFGFSKSQICWKIKFNMIFLILCYPKDGELFYCILISFLLSFATNILIFFLFTVNVDTWNMMSSWKILLSVWVTKKIFANNRYKRVNRYLHVSFSVEFSLEIIFSHFVFIVKLQ